MTVLGIMPLIPSHPALHPRLIKRSRIKPHDLRVAENAHQRRNVVRSHPAQVEAWGFECQTFIETFSLGYIADESAIMSGIQPNFTVAAERVML